MSSTESAPRDPASGTPELFDAWGHRGDRRARAELIRRHLPLARRLAGRYARAGEQIDDLVQVAAVGLINAVERFDPDRGTAFSSFAVPTILGEIKRYFRDNGWAVRLDRRTQERTSAVIAAERELSARGRKPSVASLATHLDYAEAEVLDALAARSARTAVSLDTPLSGGGEAEAPALADTVGSADAELEAVPEHADLVSAVRHLPRLERKIILLRFREDLSQREIAAAVGVSQMHVSRLLRRSLGALRQLVEDEPGSGA